MRVGPPLAVCCDRCGATYTRANLLSGNTFGGRVWTDGYVDAPMLPLRLTIPFFRCAECRAFTWGGGATPPVGVRSKREVMELAAADLFDAVDARIWRTPDEERLVRRLAWWLGNHAHRPKVPPPPMSFGCLLSIVGVVAFVVAVTALRATPGADLARLVAVFGAASVVAGIVWASREARRARALEEVALEREIRETPLSASAYRDDAASPPTDLDPRLLEDLRALDALFDASDPEQRLERAEIARELGRFDDAAALLAGTEWQPELMPTVAWLRRLIERRDRHVRLLPARRDA